MQIVKRNSIRLTIGCILAVILAACPSPQATTAESIVYGGVGLGPLRLGVSVNASGEVTVEGGFSLQNRVALGPLTMEFGIAETRRLTRDHKYMLYILWQDSSGQIVRDEYEIGEEFDVDFGPEEHVRRITGENDSIVVVVEGVPVTTVPPTSQSQAPPPSVTPTSIQPTAAPAVLTQPVSDSTVLSDLPVPADAGNGVQFTAPAEGMYRFTVKPGVYCTQPDLCRSIVRGYLGRDIVWKDWYGLPHPMEQDFELGCWENETTSNPNCAVGRSTIVRMDALQTITWIIMEDRNSFADDTGGVTLAVERLPSSTTPMPSAPTPANEERLPNGEVVSPESLAMYVGGQATYWTRRGPGVWGYWDQGRNAVFRHPGGNTTLTYWWGFAEPANVPADCVIEKTDYEGPTRTLRCSTAGATFSADGVGLHLAPSQ